MGSRLTRAVFRDQRNRPIDLARKEQIHNIVYYLLVFISCLFYFLFGYLYRPYLHLHPGIFFITIILYFVSFRYPFGSKAILTSLILFLVVIISKIFGFQMFFLKATLILTTLLFNTLSSSEMANSPIRHAALLWFQFQSFNSGLTLALDIQQFNALSGKARGLEEGTTIQIMFILIGLMAVTLVTFGKHYIKNMRLSHNKQTSIRHQLPHLIPSLLLLLSTFAIEKSLQTSFTCKALALATAVGIVTIHTFLKWLQKTWITILALTFAWFFIQFIIEGDYQSTKFILNVIKILILNLIQVDAIRIWSRSMNDGQQKPLITTLIYFTAFYTSQLSQTGNLIMLFSPLLIYILTAISYVVLVALNYFHNKRNYQMLP